MTKGGIAIKDREPVKYWLYTTMYLLAALFILVGIVVEFIWK